MSERGKNRADLWLFIAATTLLFRITSFLMEIAASLLGVAYAHASYAALRYVMGLLPVYGPVLAVIAALLLARVLEPRLKKINPASKRGLLIILAALALLPWQFHVRTTARPQALDEVPDYLKRTDLQRGGHYSPIAPSRP